MIYKKVILFKTLANKLSKRKKTEINFLVSCGDEYVYPKFASQTMLKKNSFNWKICLDEINNKFQSVK